MYTAVQLQYWSSNKKLVFAEHNEKLTQARFPIRERGCSTLTPVKPLPNLIFRRELQAEFRCAYERVGTIAEARSVCTIRINSNSIFRGGMFMSDEG